MEAHRTNATLTTPSGSCLVPFSEEALDSLPIKRDPTKPRTTTKQVLEQACQHLIAVDPRMKPLIERHHCKNFSPEGLAEEVDPFESLCSGIMSQQVLLDLRNPRSIWALSLYRYPALPPRVLRPNSSDYSTRPQKGRTLSPQSRFRNLARSSLVLSHFFEPLDCQNEKLSISKVWLRSFIAEI